MHKATCRDGPYAGTEHHGRALKGVVFVDKPNGTVAIYNHDADHGLIFQHEARRNPALEGRAVADPGREVRSAPW